MLNEVEGFFWGEGAVDVPFSEILESLFTVPGSTELYWILIFLLDPIAPLASTVRESDMGSPFQSVFGEQL